MNDILKPETAVEADPARPWKAYTSAAGAAVVTFVGMWVADTDPFTVKEAAQAGVAALIASGLVGVPTYAVANPLKRKA